MSPGFSAYEPHYYLIPFDQASSTSSRTSPRRRRGEQSQDMLKPAVPCSSRPCVVVGSELAWMGTRTVERLRDPGHNMPGSPSS